MIERKKDWRGVGRNNIARGPVDRLVWQFKMSGINSRQALEGVCSLNISKVDRS